MISAGGRRRVRAAVASVCLVVAAPLAPSVAKTETAPGRAVSMSTRDCDEVQIPVLIPLARAQAALPAGYTAREQVPGHGMVALAVRRCAALAVDGVDVATSASVAEVGIFINAVPGETAPQQLYQLGALTDVPALAERTTRLGLTGGFVGGIDIELTPLGGSANVPWPASPFEFTTLAPGEPLVPSTAVTFVWWHEGARGTVRSEYRFPPETVRVPVGGVVTAAEGSPLAVLLGGPSSVGVLGTVIDIPGYDGTLTLSPR